MDLNPCILHLNLTLLHGEIYSWFFVYTQHKDCFIWNQFIGTLKLIANWWNACILHNISFDFCLAILRCTSVVLRVHDTGEGADNSFLRPAQYFVTASTVTKTCHSDKNEYCMLKLTLCKCKQFTPPPCFYGQYSPKRSFFITICQETDTSNVQNYKPIRRQAIMRCFEAHLNTCQPLGFNSKLQLKEATILKGLIRHPGNQIW